MTAMRALEDAESVNDHLCVAGNRCCNKVDGEPRETEKPRTFCAACLKRTISRVEQFPEQWASLRDMIGDRNAGIDVNIRRPKPDGSVPLNIHVDSLLGDIFTDLTTAAEVVAEKLNMSDPTEVRQKEPIEVPPWAHSPKQEAAEQIARCVRIIAPNLHILATATGVGGREDDDRDIDIMVWKLNGRWHMPATTTGVKLIKRLDHLGSLAYFTLGLTRARQQRSMPCTRCRAKTVGRWAGSEWWDCTSCGSQFPEDELRRQDKILLELIKRGVIDPKDMPRE
jgi:hypothetical protein